MTEREFEQRIRAWYQRHAEAAGPMPPELRERILSIPDRVPTVPDRAGRRDRLVLLAAAAMLLVALTIGAIAVGSFILRLPRPDSELTPVLPPPAWTDQQMTPLPPGPYYLDLPAAGPRGDVIRVTFTVPDNWEPVRIDGLLWGQTKWVSFSVPTHLYVNGCEEHVLADPPVGPTAADLADALPSVADWTVVRSGDASLDGYAGKRVELVAPAGDLCLDDSRLFRVNGFPRYLAAIRDHERVTLWILDVGDERLVIWEGSEIDATASELAERRALVDSIEIQLLPGIAVAHRRGSNPD